ncbi:MAG: hypothetical protein IJ298_08475 [Ruminococcus sp.]|nr:hypothetical protein [Ruminococcus sp.]
MISKDTDKEHISNLTDEEKEILIRFRLLSDEEKQKLIKNISDKSHKNES